MAKSDQVIRVEHQPSRTRLIALTVLLGVGVVGCSDGDSAAPPATVTNASRSSSTTATTDSTTTESATTSSTSTSTPIPTSTSTPGGPTAEDEIIARYIGYWEARFAANSGTPDPDDPALRDFATGAQLEAVIAETRANLEQGLALRQADEPIDFQQVQVIEIDGDRAVVQECVVDDLVVVRRESGEVINDAIATHNVRGELQQVEGAWRVSEARLIQRWEGVAGCAPAR